MPKIFQICQEFPRAFRGFPILIFYYFFHNASTRNAKKSIKPSKTSPLPRAADVTDCLQKPVKTCQNNLWFCKHCQKGQNGTMKSLFFSLNYKSFPIQIGFEQLDPLASDGHLEKGCFPSQTGVWGC